MGSNPQESVDHYGKRDKAEEMFRKSIEKDPNNVWNTIDMAGSYVGVKPQ